MDIDCIIAIDPGKTNGGICIWQPDTVIKTIPMPEIVSDLEPLLRNKLETRTCLAFVEKVQPNPNDPPAKMIRMQALFANYGVIKDVLQKVGMPFVMVAPMTWKSNLKLAGRKERNPYDQNKQVRAENGEIVFAPNPEYTEFAKRQKKKQTDFEKAEALKYFPDAGKVTGWNVGCLLLCQFARNMIRHNPAWIRDNLPKDIQKRFTFDPQNQ